MRRCEMCKNLLFFHHRVHGGEADPLLPRISIPCNKMAACCQAFSPEATSQDRGSSCGAAAQRSGHEDGEAKTDNGTRTEDVSW